MRFAWHDVRGDARGLVMRLVPRTRLILTCALLLACVVAPVASPAGAGAVCLICLAWIAACRPPGRVVGQSAILALVLFLPYFLLLPWLDPAPGPLGRWTIPWTLFSRGAGGLVISLVGMSTLSPGDLRDAASRLPLPGVATAIIVQIAHQSSVLLEESRRIGAAMAVRGATGRGAPTWKVLSALPQVWLPRVLDRAERVGAAMALRGYCESSGRFLDDRSPSLRDHLALLLGMAALSGAMALRWWP